MKDLKDGQPFWRSTPLSWAESSLLSAVADAHKRSASRLNPSACAFQNAWAASHDYGKAVASAVLALGGPHAPIAETVQLLSTLDPLAVAERMVASGLRVPGWGNSFHREVPDPLWTEVDSLINTLFHVEHLKLDAITDYLVKHLRRPIYPNPSAYTAITAVIVGMPSKVASYLFIAARLEAWTATLTKKGSQPWESLQRRP